MKKIMFFMIGFSAILFVILTFFIYIVNAGSDLLEKKQFCIEHSECTPEETIEILGKICDEANLDILVRVYETTGLTYNEADVVNIIYKTNNNEDFLNWHSGTGTCLVEPGTVLINSKGSGRKNFKEYRLFMPRSLGIYAVYSLTDMTPDELDSATFFTNEEYFETLKKLSCEYGITIDEKGSVYVDLSYEMIVLCTSLALLGLSFLSMLFWQLSRSKVIAIRRLEGYSFWNIACNFTKTFLSGFIPVFLSAMTVGAVICSLWESLPIFMYFILDYWPLPVAFVIAWTLAFFASCIHIVFVNPLSTLKGEKKQKSLYVITVIAKLCLVLIIGVVAYYCYIGAEFMLSVNEVAKAGAENYSDYYFFNLTENVENIEYEVLDSDMKKFTDKMSLTHNVVLMDPSSAYSFGDDDTPEEIREYMKADNEYYEYTGNVIAINKSYMDINPVYSPDGSKIEPSDLPEDKFVILVPEGTDREEVRKAYADSDYLKEYESGEMLILEYSKDQKFYGFSTDYLPDTVGYFENTIVLLDEKYTRASSQISCGLLIFEGNTDDFYNEILPLLEDFNLTGYVGDIISVGAQLNYMRNYTQHGMAIYFGALFFCVCLLTGVIFYECVVYYKNNQKIITIKKMNGFSFIDIHGKHLVLRAGFYAFIVIWFVLMKCPLWFSLLCILLDFIIFCIALESRTSKYAATVLKGDLA